MMQLCVLHQNGPEQTMGLTFISKERHNVVLHNCLGCTSVTISLFRRPLLQRISHKKNKKNRGNVEKGGQVSRLTNEP